MQLVNINMPIRDLKIIERNLFKDRQGSLTCLYCANDF